LGEEYGLVGHHGPEAPDEIVQVRNMIEYSCCGDQVRLDIQFFYGFRRATVPECLAHSDAVRPAKFAGSGTGINTQDTHTFIPENTEQGTVICTDINNQGILF
jgi:hypothetical protein